MQWLCRVGLHWILAQKEQFEWIVFNPTGKAVEFAGRHAIDFLSIPETRQTERFGIRRTKGMVANPVPATKVDRNLKST